MVDALGGVGVYVSEDIDDPEYTQLKLDKVATTLMVRQRLCMRVCVTASLTALTCTVLSASRT